MTRRRRPPSEHRDTRRRVNVDDNVIYLNFGAAHKATPPASDRARHTPAPAARASRTASRTRIRTDRGAYPWPALAIMRQLDENTESGRKKRGRDYVRNNAIQRVDVDNWTITAQVMGSQLEPFTVHAHVPHSLDACEDAIRYLARDTHAYEKFVAGKEDPHLEAILFPFDDTRWACSCPDPHLWCKHVYAVGLFLQERFAQDRSAVFHLANTSYGDIRERVSQRVGTRQTFPVHEDSIDVQDSQTLMAQHREPSVDPETFWGVPTTYPAPPIVPHTSALDDHDQQALMKVLRWVSYGAIGQLNAHSDLEDVYHHLMTTPPEMHHPEKTTMTTPDSQETHD